MREWIKKQDPSICYVQVTHFKYNDISRLKEKGQKTTNHVNTNIKKAGVPVFVLDKVDLKARKITRNKKGHYIMIKGLIQ